MPVDFEQRQVIKWTGWSTVDEGSLWHEDWDFCWLQEIQLAGFC